MEKDGLKILSLCGGIETGILALQHLGIPIAEYHSYEILPEAIAVSSHHFPFVVHHGDMIGEDFTKYRGFDLILAGTCCQSISRLRTNDKNVCSGLKGKSKIFFEAVRAVEEVQPKWFMFENVIPDKDEDLKTMNKCLGVEGKLIDSALFSPQSRERYYWTNFEIPELPCSNEMVFADVMETDVEEKYYINKPYEPVDMNKRVCTMIIENNLEMCRRVYNSAFKMCTLTCISGGGQQKKVFDNGRPRKLTEIEYERLQGLPDNFTNVEVNGRKISYSKRCSLMGNGWNEPTIEHIFRGLKNVLGK